MTAATVERVESDVCGVPRWVEWTARVTTWTTIPSGLWRIALGLGMPVGFSGSLAHTYEAPSWTLTPYVLVLSGLVETLAFLTMGLVRPWGETVPRWMPFLGGKAVSPLSATVPAALGALAVTVITITGALAWNGPHAMGDPESPQGLKGLIMTACYAPLLAWGPLLALVTVAYWIRRTRQG